MMQCYRDDKNTADADKHAVLALGNFDGVHLGHQAILTHVRSAANDAGVKAGVLSFSPHPRRFFAPDSPPFLLTTDAEKQAILAQHQMDLLYLLPFDATLAAMSAEDFIENILVQNLAVKQVVMGYDFTFGKDRHGTSALLKKYGNKHGFEVSEIAPQKNGEMRYSSTAVRQALQQANLELVHALLGRDYSMSAIVEKGDQQGREIGFPTINLALAQRVRPRYGVYTGRCVLADGTSCHAVINIGVRPTAGGTKEWVEAHLLDFDGDLYGQSVTLSLKSFLRPEQAFDSFASLRAQIEKDVSQAKELLA